MTKQKLAIAEFERLLGAGRVFDGKQARVRYARSAEGVSRTVAGAILPETRAQVVAAVKMAGRLAVPLYPISTGHNWGYGSALPVRDGCVVLDLSRMNRILRFDNASGEVTIEPGVTQEQLFRYVRRKNVPYMVPATDSGPACSIVGQILERGLGITHRPLLLDSVTSMEAVLPNGEIHQMLRHGNGLSPHAIFTQSSFGIVTRVSLELAPIPERVEFFSFQLEKESDLERVLPIIQNIRRNVGKSLNLINLVNPLYALAMMISYPYKAAARGKAIPQHAVAKLCEQYRLPPWMGGGAIFGETKSVEAVRAYIKRKLSPVAKTVTFVTPELIDELKETSASKTAHNLEETLEHLRGKSIEFPLKLAYWKSGKPGRTRLDPALDGCGIIWYAPLVPAHPSRVRRFVDMVKRICFSHGMNPLFTLVNADGYLFGIVPILFDRHNKQEVAGARACYDRLLEQGMQEGFVPYRIPIFAMKKLVNESPFWRMEATLKKLIDPLGILSPGRYSAVWR